MLIRFGRPVAIAATTLLMGAGQAWGATLQPSGNGAWGYPVQYDDLIYTAQSGERNSVTLASPGFVTATVRDPNIQMLTPKPISPLNYGCSAPTGKGLGICIGLFQYLSISLGDRNDSYTSPRGVRISSTVSAGDGNDTIDVRNGIRDYVFCGSGYDTVKFDAVDVYQPYSECEVVTRGLGLK